MKTNKNCRYCGAVLIKNYKEKPSHFNKRTTCGLKCSIKLAQKSCITHGEARSGKKLRLYLLWENMNKRCVNPRSSFYYRYGGRGITVCDEWKNSYASFSKWARLNGYSDNLQIDRINNDGPYSPDNCRFVSCRKNSQNKPNFKGGFVKKRIGYEARLKFRGVVVPLGYFHTSFEATSTYFYASALAEIGIKPKNYMPWSVFIS